jgi:hypothetical protein
MNYGNGEEILNFLYSVKIFAGDWKTTKHLSGPDLNDR